MEQNFQQQESNSQPISNPITPQKNNKKRILLLVSIIIIVVCLLGVGALAFTSDSVGDFFVKIIYNGDCDRLSNPKSIRDCVTKIVHNNECDKFANLDSREICFKEVAFEKNNVTICNNIATQDRKESCVLSLVIDKGSSPELCNKITNSIMHDQCLGGTAKSIDTCNQINQMDMKEACVASTVKLINDLAVCQGLTIGVHKLDCISNLANSLGDISICDNLGGEDRDNCRVRFANSFTNQEQCETLASEIAYGKNLIDNCYHAVALKSKDISLCYKMAEGY